MVEGTGRMMTRPQPRVLGISLAVLGSNDIPTQGGRASIFLPLYFRATYGLVSHYLLSTLITTFTMADPSGAAPQPGPDDISTAILRPKKS